MPRCDGTPRVVHHARSPHGSVYVVDEGDERTLRFDRPDGHRQSVLLRSDPDAVPAGYVRAAAAALALGTGRSRALVVGLGGGAFPMLLRRCLPAMAVDVVELNPVVVDVARRFFGLREDPQLRVFVGDGARFMVRRRPGYDLILLDAFVEAGIPDHLRTPGFFTHVLRRLLPGGVAVFNIALAPEATKAHLLRTFAQVFPHCARMLGPPESGNVLGLGGRSPLPPEPVFRKRLRALQRELRFPGLPRSVGRFERL